MWMLSVEETEIVDVEALKATQNYTKFCDYSSVD